jgi:hypothetical protein
MSVLQQDYKQFYVFTISEALELLIVGYVDHRIIVPTKHNTSIY